MQMGAGSWVVDCGVSLWFSYGEHVMSEAAGSWA
jgi:hypothetical protein